MNLPSANSLPVVFSFRWGIESKRAMVTLSGKSFDLMMSLTVGNTLSEKDNWDMLFVMAKILGNNKDNRSVSCTCPSRSGRI